MNSTADRLRVEAFERDWEHRRRRRIQRLRVLRRLLVLACAIGGGGALGVLFGLW